MFGPVTQVSELWEKARNLENDAVQEDTWVEIPKIKLLKYFMQVILSLFFAVVNFSHFKL